MRKVASVISYALHPLMMPLYLLFLIFNIDSLFALLPVEIKVYNYLVTFFFLFLMPLLSLPLFKHYHLIKSYHLDAKQERVYPILVTVGFAFVGFWLLGHIPYSVISQQLYLMLIILLSGFAIITLRWKMSMHMTALGAACGFMFVFQSKYMMGNIREIFMSLILLSGIVASARLYLKKHTPLQVYAGFLFGFLVITGILLS